MERKRSRSDIIFDMLVAIQRKGGEIKPTHLMYKANLSYVQMNSYLEELIGNGLISKVNKDKGDYFIITDKGNTFVQKLKEMREFEEAFGL